MFLQLTAQGTKSKILGQGDERGGWAVPTPQNQWCSKYENFPTGKRFDESVHSVRLMPAVAFENTTVPWVRYFANTVGSDTDGVDLWPLRSAKKGTSCLS